MTADYGEDARTITVEGKWEAADVQVAVAALGGSRIESTGGDYCTLHHGVRNEDEDSCDFARRDLDEPDICGEDGEPRECVLKPMVYFGGHNQGGGQ